MGKAMPRTTEQLEPTGRYRLPPLPAGWKPLAPLMRTPHIRELRAFLQQEATQHAIYPPAGDVFRALELTPLRRVRVLLLGQDPYPGAGQANGLCFSVRPGVKPPASLRNMFRELQADVGVPPPSHGALDRWARQGVLLLNAVLTVRAGAPNSHRDRGWESFTDAVIRRASAKRNHVVFALWGAYAQKKTALIDTTRHAIIAAAHPSPLSARHGFFGSRPYSRINTALAEAGRPPIDWRLE
jgi:uracil-DNA glycosylase